MTKIDAHMHLWQLRDVKDSWVATMPKLARDFSAVDYKPLMDAAGIQSAILVQALESERETVEMVALAKQHDWIAGVIGWVDLAGQSAPDRVAWLADQKPVVGMRNWPMIKGDPAWILRSELDHGFAALAASRLTYDTLARPENLPSVIARLARTPGLRVCLNHLAYPQPGWDIGGKAERDWISNMSELAGAGCVVKLSGFGHRQDGTWQPEIYDRFVDQIFRIFGPQNVIWASNWPTVLTECSYQDWFEASTRWTNDISERGLKEVWGGTARRFYRLGT